MKFILTFHESKKILTYDEQIFDFFPKKLSIYTSDGSYTMNLSEQSSREVDVIRAIYSRNTTNEDGQPDSLSLDIHTIKNESGFKTITDIIYGDNIKFQISIESPNKVTIGTYNGGLRSVMDPQTQFGFDDDSIEQLCKFFNTFDFGYNLRPEDLSAIDKYPDSYKPENTKQLKSQKNGIKNTFKKGDSIILVIDNTKEPEHNFLNNILNYLRVRGEKFEVASTIDEMNKILSEYDVIGAISTGSDHRISKDDNGAKLSYEAYKNLKCPILGLCYGMQSMVKFYGGEIMDSGKHTHDHLKLTFYKKEHDLFKNIDIQDIEFSFSFNDIISKMPQGFSQIAMLDDLICGISDKQIKRYGLLFHPEDVDMTYPILDNFISICKGKNEFEEQKKIQMGQFEHLISFKNFAN